MEIDQMKIDPDILEMLISLIDNYSNKQIDVLNNYISEMNRLNNEWDDSKGYIEMIKYLETTCKRSILVFSQIRDVYKKFYFDEVLDIRKVLSSIKV